MQQSQILTYQKRDMDADALCGFLIPITFSGSFDVGFIVEDNR